MTDWIEANKVYEYDIDVRRMMSFGVIKGFLRRCYAYPVWLDHPTLAPANAATNQTNRESGSNVSSALGNLQPRGRLSQNNHPASMTSQPSVASRRRNLTPNSDSTSTAYRGSPPRSGANVKVPSALPMLLDGRHHTDELCVKFRMSLTQLEPLLRNIGFRNGAEAISHSSSRFGRVEMVYI